MLSKTSDNGESLPASQCIVLRLQNEKEKYLKCSVLLTLELSLLVLQPLGPGLERTYAQIAMNFHRS